MEKVTSGTIEMVWDAASRVAHLRFSAETRAAGRDATVLVQALTRWIGTDPKPFGLLGDGKGLAGVDAEYRAVWGKFLRQHRDTSCVAFFHMNPFIRIAAEMFRLGTGLRLKAFAKEEQARSWLRRNGLTA